MYLRLEVEWDSKLHMVLGGNSQKEISGSGVVPFRMERSQLMQVQDVLFVPGLRYNVMYVSAIKQKGFEVLFQGGKARLRPRGSSSAGVVIGVREHGLYRKTGKPIDHGKKKQKQVKVLEKQVQDSEKWVQVLEKKVHDPEVQREPSSRGSLQV